MNAAANRTLRPAGYLDHAATTPIRPQVLERMIASAREGLGNPSSSHRRGRGQRKRLERARRRLARALGARPEWVRFTSGGTEADNLAVLGAFGRSAARGSNGHLRKLCVSSIEHSAVREPALRLAAEGVPVAEIGVDPERGVDLDALGRELDGSSVLVSAIWAHNETGILLPIGKLAQLCRERGALLHADAVQAVGKTPVSLDEVPLHYASVAGHKVGGPVGTGALIVRNDAPEPAPLCFGGKQERGTRPGTQDVVGAEGLAFAVALAVREQENEAARLEAIRDEVEVALLDAVPDIRVNGGSLARAPHISSLGIPGVDPGLLMGVLDQEGIAASTGSACASAADGPSPSLSALYPDAPLPALRLSYGRLNRIEDAPWIVRALSRAISLARS